MGNFAHGESLRFGETPGERVRHVISFARLGRIDFDE
jgi:hypothetical protein